MSTMAVFKPVWFFFSCFVYLDAGILPVKSSEGYIPDCPGTDLPVQIPKKVLDNLFFVVYKKKTNGVYRQDYTYSQAVSKIAKDPEINWSKKTAMYVPGYMESTRLPLASMIGDAYSKLDYNVLMLDTTYFTIRPFPMVARIAKAIGASAARVLASLVERGLNPKTLEVIGTSLGGHISSFIGKRFQALTSTKISRITALDPGGPCFRNLPPSSRLDSSDADFVDVIHTNVDGLGGAKPWGHVDFYVNGGKYQISFIPAIPCLVLCNHLRAIYVWVEALERPHAFKAIKCDSEEQAGNFDCYDRSPMETNVMGLSTNKNLTGIFLLNTSYKPPYGLGRAGLSKQSEGAMTMLSEYNQSSAINW